MYKLCANWVMVSCYNSICSRDIPEIDKMGCQTGRMGGIVTIMAKKPHQTSNNEVLPCPSTQHLLGCKGCSETWGPQTEVPPKHLCPAENVPTRQNPALPWCHGFFSIKLRCPQGWPHSSWCCSQLRGTCPSPASQPFPEPPLPLGVTLLISSCGRYQWKQDKGCLSSSMLQLQGPTSPWYPLVQSHSTRLHQPEAQILMYMHLSVCFPWGTLNFINLPLWTVMNTILPLVFQNPAEQT